MKNKHYTIPFFIPHRGCPHQCVFCDQKKITGRTMMSPEDITMQIERYLETIPSDGAKVEVGFFGGTFTGLPREVQNSFLRPVQKYVNDGRVHGIRLSTRPDLIDRETLCSLRANNVTCIELGVQSMSDKVLSAVKRGHTAEDVERASELIVLYGFILGHQMMLGLPQSSAEDEYFTARSAVKLGAAQVRIYPVLVINNTELADLWAEGRYTPLSEKKAVERCAVLILYFGSNGIRVIRCGLHPSEGLLTGNDFSAGPFHPAFKMKAESLIFSFMLEYIAREIPAIHGISFNPKDASAFFGFKKENAAAIKKVFGGEIDSLTADPDVPRGDLALKGKTRSLLTRKIIAGKYLPEGLQKKPARTRDSREIEY